MWKGEGAVRHEKDETENSALDRFPSVYLPFPIYSFLSSSPTFPRNMLLFLYFVSFYHYSSLHSPSFVYFHSSSNGESLGNVQSFYKNNFSLLSTWWLFASSSFHIFHNQTFSIFLLCVIFQLLLLLLLTHLFNSKLPFFEFLGFQWILYCDSWVV